MKLFREWLLEELRASPPNFMPDAMSEYHANIGHVPRKRFGQHFLHDPGILRRIVHALRRSPATASSRSVPAKAR